MRYMVITPEELARLGFFPPEGQNTLYVTRVNDVEIHVCYVVQEASWMLTVRTCSGIQDAKILRYFVPIEAVVVRYVCEVDEIVKKYSA